MSSATTTPSPTSGDLEPRPKKKLFKPMLAMVGLVLFLVAAIGGTKVAQISKVIAQSKQAPPHSPPGK